MVAMACMVPLTEADVTPITWVSLIGTAVTAVTARPIAVWKAGLVASVDDTPVTTT